MKNFIFYAFSCITLISCIPKRIGKVKKIYTGQVQRGDSIILLQPYYTYATFANEITCCDWYKPSEKQLEIEKQWDSILYSVLQYYFESSKVKYGTRNEYYDIRPFKFKFTLGTTKDIMSDSISYIMSLFSWNIRAGNLQKAFAYLPDSILNLSYKRPLAILTNEFYFYDIDFQAHYASGSTGLQFRPESFIVILKNGNIQYFRGYRKGIAYHKVLKNPSFIDKFTIKLLDKLN